MIFASLTSTFLNRLGSFCLVASLGGAAFADAERGTGAPGFAERGADTLVVLRGCATPREAGPAFGAADYNRREWRECVIQWCAIKVVTREKNDMERKKESISSASLYLYPLFLPFVVLPFPLCQDHKALT
jgi:hypothetical protein